MWKWTQERKVNGSSEGEEASMNTNARGCTRVRAIITRNRDRRSSHKVDCTGMIDCVL
ncbi:hypothetical protein HanRHA438_Chr05g0206181 [Helianthus annuus]|uniref:Uncharacterized protein n=1 Tax=Helianthus annuus TaxID=4232 RepID=A0A251ULC1_HELAN|nr:hypothetical protein HanXRQr2_Chr05g0196671 [Helianthus annuus]KAJ0569043.1 hypothetical protein HanHA300_Chr05g0161581 [Helianthus annuus]KAJ0583323.1 hypothetical protein HanHA89_Chr05g0175261 [Helianthus annuus]KAJ0749062.1 hypothetical protein HanLR1_Chr05g0165471 [Helianthus annuus]KAJ0917457.1 hypothetical protein HanRHA438_Chr05g0206181 [Helianthus annuus]